MRQRSLHDLDVRRIARASNRLLCAATSVLYVVDWVEAGGRGACAAETSCVLSVWQGSFGVTEWEVVSER